MDLEKLLFKFSKVRLKTLKLGVQSKFIWYLELYISRITYPRKVVFYRLKLLQTCIRKNKIQYFKAISKYIIVAQKCKKKAFGRIFCIFECLLPQNPTNQGSQLSWFLETIWKTIKNFKNTRLQGIISVWKWFQNLLGSKFFKKHLDFGNSNMNFFLHALLHKN